MKERSGSANPVLPLLFLCLLLAAALPLFGAASGSPAVSPTDAPVATPTELPACSLTGEHEWKDYSFAGDGTHTAVCALCGETLTEPCDYGEAPVWTPTGDGSHAVACLLCGGEKTEPCAPADEVVRPTQEEAGFTRHVCAVCGDTVTDTQTPPERERAESRLLGDADGDGGVTPADARLILRAVVVLERLSAKDLSFSDLDRDGKLTPADARSALRLSVGLDGPADRHDYTVRVIRKATCTEGGNISYTCSYCGAEGEMESPPDGHQYRTPKVKAATCTKAGKSTRVCKVCGYQDVKTIPATGHRYGDPVVKEATCTKEGVSTVTCTVCGHKEKTPLPVTGHKWQDDAEKNKVVCSVCGAGASGWMELNGKTYHCVKGVKDYSWCVIDGDRYFFDRNTGAMASGVKIDGIKLAADGKAPTDWYSVEKIRTFINAKKIVAQITDSDDSVSVKKKKAFDWVMGYSYVQYRLVGASMSTPGFEMLFANDIFEKNRTGCCGSTSYAFAFLAVECGCKAVYVCDDGVSTSGHAWVTMEGNNNVYDVVFAKAKGYNINYKYHTSDYRNWPPRKTYVGG